MRNFDGSSNSGCKYLNKGQCLVLVEVIDIIDLVATVLGKRTPNLAILSQMVNGAMYFI